MKKILTVAMLAAAIILTGCNKHEISGGTAGQGCLQLSVNKGDDLTVKSSSSDVDIDSFIITFTTSSNPDYKLSYTFGQFKSTFDDGIIYMDPGNYTVTVTSPDTENVAWDQPIYGCTKDFTIKSEVITSLELVCTIQNMKVTVITTAQFRAEFYDYNIVITGTYDGENESLTWTPDNIDEDIAGYYAVSDLEVAIKGVRASGSIVTETRTITGNAAADYHIITIGATATGSSTISITIDDSLNNRDVGITVPGFDEPDIDDPDDGDDNNGGGDDNNGGGDGGSTVPTLTWSTNPNFNPTYLADEMDVDLVVSAPEGIKAFFVNIESTVLQSMLSLIGISLPMDLINDEAAMTMLDGLGVPVGDKLLGATEVDFNISGLVPMVYRLGPEAGSQHKFTLTVTDNKDQVLEQELVFIMPTE